MADISPAALVVDGYGNQVKVALDGSIYRLQTQTKVDGYSIGPLPVMVVSPNRQGVSLDGYSVEAIPTRVGNQVSTKLDGYSIGPLPVMLRSPNRIGTSLDGYSVDFTPVKIVSPNRVGTSIDGYSIGKLPTFARIDGYSIGPLPVLLASPNRVSTSLDGYSIGQLPIRGMGTPGSPANGVVTVQGVTGGTQISVTQGTRAAAAGAWPLYIVDSSGNAVGLVLDGAVYRLQSDAKVAKGASNLVHLEVLDTETGKGRLKATLYSPEGEAVAFGSVPPSAASIRNLFALNGGSDNLLVDGSVTPVVFTYPAHPTQDISLQEIKFVLVSNSVTFGSNYFGATAGPLTNGVLVEVVAGGVAGTIYNLKQNESFINFASLGGFEWVVSSKDMMSSTYMIGGGLKLTAGSGDMVRITVRDDIDAAGVYLKCFVKGNLLTMI